jgi:Hemerythrin HHE cation binding domain
MSVGRAQDILIGPRTTVHGLLRAYPFLESFLLGRVRGFERLHDERARTRWARVMTLDDVGLRLNLPWQQLVREIAAEVERETGRLPRVADAPRRIADDARRLGELRDIVEDLEDGGPLLELAARWRAATGDLEQAETAALDAALSEALAAGRAAASRAPAAADARDGTLAAPPAGHPLDTLRREALHVRQLIAALKAELERLGGSPARRRWQREKPLVVRLVDRLAAVELRFRREQQAWFPAFEVHGVDGPQALLQARQAETLETLRRLRLAVERDDAPSVAETGARLVDALEDLLAQDERLLEPLATRHFSAGDWGAVRELEDGVGWGLIPAPPAWPDS